MTQQFKVGDSVRLSGQRGLGPEFIYTDAIDKIGKVCFVGRINIKVIWDNNGTELWYAPPDLEHASVFYAETDKKGLVI